MRSSRADAVAAAARGPATTDTSSGRIPIVIAFPLAPANLDATRWGRLISQSPPSATNLDGPPPSTVPFAKFIAGFPMKPATNLFFGFS